MRFKKMETAKRQAKANADLTGVPWVVFIDTSLCPNVERFNANLLLHRAGSIFKPSKGGTA